MTEERTYPSNLKLLLIGNSSVGESYYIIPSNLAWSETKNESGSVRGIEGVVLLIIPIHVLLIDHRQVVPVVEVYRR
jgi:hypothetical protein